LNLTAWKAKQSRASKSRRFLRGFAGGSDHFFSLRGCAWSLILVVLSFINDKSGSRGCGEQAGVSALFFSHE